MTVAAKADPTAALTVDRRVASRAGQKDDHSAAELVERWDAKMVEHLAARRADRLACQKVELTVDKTVDRSADHLVAA